MALSSIPQLRISESCCQLIRESFTSTLESNCQFARHHTMPVAKFVGRSTSRFAADSMGVQLPILSRLVPSVTLDSNCQFRPCLLCPSLRLNLASAGVRLPVRSSKIGSDFQPTSHVFQSTEKRLKTGTTSRVPTSRRPPTSPRGTPRRSVQTATVEHVELTRNADGSPLTWTRVLLGEAYPGYHVWITPRTSETQSNKKETL